MMLAPSGEKLSKRHGAVSVTEYRNQGYAPDAVLNYLVRFGWSHGDQEIFSKQELIEAFNWDSCGRGDGKFDTKKFMAIQHEHLKSKRLTPDEEYVAGIRPFLTARGISNVSNSDISAGIATVRERCRTYVEAAESVEFFYTAKPTYDPKAVEKFLVSSNLALLEELTKALESSSGWSEGELDSVIHAWLNARGIQIKDVAQPARVALTGRSVSPGLFQVLAVLGRKISLERLKDGIRMIREKET
jgi:glutamyl-tRNA synthetase